MAAAGADVALLRLARTAGHSPATERAVAAFSKTGEHAAVWLVLGFLGALVDRDRRRAWQRALGIVAGAYALNTVVKLVARRRRPLLDGLPPLIGTPTQLSFPSAHATSSFAAAQAYAPLVGHRGLLYALAVALSVSRVYLGVHYPSDIVGGAVLGTVVAGCGR